MPPHTAGQNTDTSQSVRTHKIPTPLTQCVHTRYRHLSLSVYTQDTDTSHLVCTHKIPTPLIQCVHTRYRHLSFSADTDTSHSLSVYTQDTGTSHSLSEYTQGQCQSVFRLSNDGQNIRERCIGGVYFCYLGHPTRSMKSRSGQRGLCQRCYQSPATYV